MHPNDPPAILFIEDNPFDIELTLRVLRQCGFGDRVAVVRDGAEALDYIFATGRYAHRRIEDLPRLVILDLKLPKVNGLQVLQWIRADRHTRDVPVMILTSSESDRDVIEVHKLGVAAYVVKPLERDEFLQIARQVGLASSAAPSPMQPRPA
ncbi:MAG TPA: response regulator [Planctomycetota bacterium]|jgi:CheY-like chemotaxis protein|nr:response regulator [Planctomycetota bacterium]